MSIIGLVLVLALLGVALWAVVTYVPMPAPMRGIIIAVAVVAVVAWLLGGFGPIGILHTRC